MTLQPGVAPNAPEDWITYLVGKLGAQQRYAQEYQEYYDAEECTLSFAQEKFREEFGDLFNEWRDNFCSLVVDSITERLRINGFRFGDSPDADKEATEIWQRNFLDSESNAAHIDALVTGASYLVVWGDDADAKDKTKKPNPLIVPESSHDVVVQYAPGSRRKLVAALKRYYDDWGTEYNTLWLPDGVYTRNLGPGMGTSTKMDLNRKPNPLGVVPVVPLLNRARLKRNRRNGDTLYKPYSELTPIIPLQRAITKIAADAIVASEFLAYPQRIIAGIEFDEDPQGNPLSPIKSAIDRLLMFEDENVSYGQFAAADLGNYQKLIDLFVQHISTISRVPPHYFLVGGANFPSGEALIAAEAGLVAKARERMLYFGEAWEEAMRLAFKVKGDARAHDYACETIWADPEYRSEAQIVDALVKRREIGVPDRQLQEDYGYTPAQIERFGEMLEAQRKEELEYQKELVKAMPQPAMQPGGQNKPASKAPQGNAGNNARKTNSA